MRFKTMTESEFTILYNYFSVNELSKRLHDPFTNKPLSLKVIHQLRDRYGLPGKPKGRPIQEVTFKDENDEIPQDILDLLTRLQKEEREDIEFRRQQIEYKNAIKSLKEKENNSR